MARQLLRSTAAHNSLRIDGEETSRLGNGRWLWLIENDARPKDVQWLSDTHHDVLMAAHDGYRRLPEPVEHSRRIVFNKDRRWWRIDDSLTGSGEHLAELFFHPGVKIDLEDDAVRFQAPHGDLWLFAPDESVFRQEPGWISAGYGLREPATVLVFAAQITPPCTLRTDLILVPSGTPASVARSQVKR
jgi:uncharacterized heparinase superfamily protein